MRALDNLINAELVEQAGGKFKTSTDKKVNFTVQSFKNALKGHVDNMLFENLEENLAFGYIQWGTISKEAYCQALVALKKNMQEIESLITNNPGNIPIYFLSLGNSYVDLKSFTEREKRKNEKN
jgi:signal recognition particle GTPase